LAVHHFDALRFLLQSEVAEVTAACDDDGETAIFSARMDDGTLVSSAFGVGAGDSHELEIFAERGRLRLSLYRFDGFEQFAQTDYSAGLRARVRQAKSTLRQLPRALAHARRGGVNQASYAAQWQGFVDALSDDTPPHATLLDGRRALEIALAATRSSSQGNVVRIRGDEHSLED
jgi:predicted dehydrogenase